MPTEDRISSFDEDVALHEKRLGGVIEKYDSAVSRLSLKGLDYSDEDIRMLSASVNTGVLGVFAADRDLNRAIAMRQRIDSMELEDPKFKFNLAKVQEELRPYFPSGDIALRIVGLIATYPDEGVALLEENEGLLTPEEVKIMRRLLKFGMDNSYSHGLVELRDLLQYPELLEEFPSDEDFGKLWRIVSYEGIYALEAFCQDPDFFDNDLDILRRNKDVLTSVAKIPNWIQRTKRAFTKDLNLFDDDDKYRQKNFVAEKADRALEVMRRITGGKHDWIEMVDEIGCYVSGTYLLLANLSTIYGDDEAKFRKVCSLLGGHSDSSLKRSSFLGTRLDTQTYLYDLITKNIDLCGRTIEEFEEFIKFLEFLVKYRHLMSPQKIIDRYYRDPQTREFFYDFMRVARIVDFMILDEFIARAKNKSLEAARTWFEEINDDSRDLIGPEIPFGVRKKKHYEYAVKLVFPKGNHSNHADNIACGDRLEHLAEYEFDREGYATEMSGLLGYRVVDGKKENEELLEDYSMRLTAVRSFIDGRDAGDESLCKAFEERVDKMFDAKVDEEFTRGHQMTVKEKVLTLLINEVARKARASIAKGTSKARGKAYKPGIVDFQPDQTVLDLVIEYKYVFLENIEDYYRRTATESSRQPGSTSCNYYLWKELSGIYGEDLKHILRHNIFDGVSEENSAMASLANSFYRMLADGDDAFLTSKQSKRLSATIQNSHIPWVSTHDDRTGRLKPGKFDVVCKQVISIFMANIKFTNDEDREECKAKMVHELAVLQEEQVFTEDDLFEKVVPRLARIRRSYLYKLDEKLEELFSSDINAINKEIAKYKEVVEVGEKQVGDEKNKTVEKSSKVRRVRAFFTKTKETANARMSAWLCLAGDKEMWENENYFELVLKDEDTGKFLGLCMLLDIKKKDGGRYLWFGPNPTESFLGQVSSKQCYQFMYKVVTDFAASNGFDGVVVPLRDEQILGLCTNRGGDFPELIKESRLLGDGIVDFDEVQVLGKYRGNAYGYQDGALIWKKKCEEAA